jgi:uncharacterized membrane protein YoaK (UPF0700 family)
VPRSIAPATVLLTFGTGVVDGSTFLSLGHVFASVMTGNLVLLGLAAGTGRGLTDRLTDRLTAWETGRPPEPVL